MKPLKPKFLPETIESKRIFLKKHELKQAKIMFSYVKKDRKRLRKFLPWVDKIKKVSDEVEFIKATHRSWKEYSHFDFSIFHKADNVYIGNIGVHNFQWEKYSCEIGYWISLRQNGFELGKFRDTMIFGKLKADLKLV